MQRVVQAEQNGSSPSNDASQDNLNAWIQNDSEDEGDAQSGLTTRFILNSNDTTNKRPSTAAEYEGKGETQETEGTMNDRESTLAVQHSGVQDKQDEHKDIKENKVEQEEEVYCICRQPYDNTFMIECCQCKDWFHGR